MKILFLDDNDIRYKMISLVLRDFRDITLDWTQTAEETIAKLQTDEYDVVMLDHDLGGKIYVPSGKGTGYEVAEWMKFHMQHKMPVVYLHTQNEVGAEYMHRVLPDSKIIPFPELIKSLQL